MLTQALFERALAWLLSQRGEGHLAEARRAFERATGPIDEAAQDYEPRISHFLEQHLCEGDPAPVAAFARAEPALSADARRELAGWLRSHRSVFAFEGFHAQGGCVRDCIFGGIFHIWPSGLDRELSAGDRLDARLIPLGELLCLSPGRVYHPREAHRALDQLLAQVAVDSLPRAELLNGLLLMRSRFLQFERVRAEHVYQARALAPVQFPLRP